MKENPLPVFYAPVKLSFNCYSSACSFFFPQSKKTKTKMPSLVKKWQSIQKELDEEDKSSSSDEDRDQLNKRTIEEWKSQMLLT